MGKERFLETLTPILQYLSTLDVNDAQQTREGLQERFPLGSTPVSRVREIFLAGVEEGWLCDQGAGAARFSRVAKADPASTENFSIDAVRLEGKGVWHRHTGGEVNLCFAQEGEPRFEGFPEGWVVFPPGSDHVPTVTGGTMDIVYFIPRGALEWKRG